MILRYYLVGVFCLTFGMSGKVAGWELNKSLICPFVTDSSDIEKPFPPFLPVYRVGSKQQIWVRNGWKGTPDYSAEVRFSWEKQALNICFDIKDDAFFPSRSQDLENLSGDYILLLIQPKSAAPNVIKEMFRILIAPDPLDGTCDVKMFPGETPAALIGKPVVTVKQVEGGYKMLFTLSTRLWNSRPAQGKDLDIQIVFGDSDVSGKVEHTMALFPTWGSFGTFLNSLGHLQFMTDQWVHAYPQKAKFDKGTMDVKLTCGNRSTKPVMLGFSILDQSEKVVKEYDNIKMLAPGDVLSGDVVSVDLPDLEPAKEYTVYSHIGELISPASFKLVVDADLKDTVFCPGWIEKRVKLKHPNLPVTKENSLINETLRTIAGGGTVLWRAGVYDGTSREFPEVMRENGKYTIEAKEGVAEVSSIPWSLFGGVDALDGMNEPLEISIPKELGAQLPPFQPDYPISFEYLTLDKTRKRKANSANKLLLIGLVCTDSGGDQNPTIQVKNQKNKLLVEARLRPGSSQFAAQPHAYILRVWLSPQDTSVRIENVNERGRRAEIDFMALMGGGGDPIQLPDDQPRIAFDGGDEAKMFNKMLVTNLFFARNYLMSPDGRVQPSLPGGRFFLFKLPEHMALLEELSAWNKNKPIERGITNISLAHSWEHKRFKSNDPVSNMLGVITVWNYWRKSGLDKVILDTHWQTVIRDGLAKVKDAVTSNSMGLMGGTGEFGTASNDRGVSLPLNHIALSALACGVEMATVVGEGEAAEEWTGLIHKIEQGIQVHLTAAPGGEAVRSPLLYKAAHGLPEQKGVRSLIPQGTFIYGKTANKEIVLYNNDVRVFDTPYLFAGLPYITPRSGYTISAQDRRLLKKTVLYLRANAVLKQSDFLNHSLVTYKSSATQLWMITAMLLDENINYAGKMIESLVQYNFDEYSPLHINDDIEVSPFALEEKFNLAANGDNMGGSRDEVNAKSVALLLKLSRLMAGLDDHDLQTLKITPRIPASWNSVKVDDWYISHDIDNSVKGTKVHMTYRRANGGFKLDFKALSYIQKIEVRIGPFRSNENRVYVSVNGKRSLKDTVNINGTRWVFVPAKRVNGLTIEAVPAR
ncbi:hypothetical protein BVX99_00755 [bacterium F16]|nr:hypothetical protein BVX99_00755 [bacterium F16]